MLAAVFHQEIAAAVSVWASSTAYNHCFLILPIAAYLVWDRHESLRGLRPEPFPAIALAGIPVALVWLAAERLGIMEGRQLAAMTFVELLFLAVLGWRLCWALAGPLLYLYFLVPFGAIITPQLQDFTTGFVQVGLNLLHIPVYIDGYTIQIPQGSFYIAEACAGLRFLIASIAFGALYALVMYRTPLRRAVFLLASLIVPVIANGFRALGIVVLGNLLGSAKAAATDHVLYGWLFFSIVILILIALGLPFREDQQTPPASEEAQPKAAAQPPFGRNGLLAVAAVCAIALLSPAAVLALESGQSPVPGSLASIDFGPDCRPLNTPAAGEAKLSCGGLVVVARMKLLSPHVTAAPLFKLKRAMTARMDSEEGYQSRWIPTAPGHPRTWRLLSAPGLSNLMAVATWVDGKPTRPGVVTRYHMAWTSIPGAPLPPAVMTVTPEVDWSVLGAEQRSAMLQRFIQVLKSWPDMTGEVQRIASRSGLGA